MRPDHQAEATILRFWRDLEIFEPQRIPKPSKNNDVIDLAPGQPAPWDPIEAAARGPLRDNERWQYQVYCGVFSLDATFEVLKDLVGDDPDAYEARARGEAALAGFVLDSTGRLIPQTATLSSSAWGLGRINALQMRAGWAQGFRSAQLAFEAAFTDLLHPRTATLTGTRELLDKLAGLLLAADGTEDPDTLLADVRALLIKATPPPTGRHGGKRTPVLDHPRLDAVRERLLAITGTTGLLPQSNPPIRIKCVKITLKKDQTEADRTPDFQFLNSHLAEDLDAVADAVHTGNLGPALTAYLTPEHDADARVDIQHRHEAAWEATRPARIPLGRWPARPEHALALGQQIAVNNALDAEGQALQGVNGPPGTGKSTLLRDVFAAVITERALRLADLDYPSYGLQSASLDRRFSIQGRNCRVPLLAPELTGFEMVVASSNNGAVENLTRETPHQEAIDPRWRGGVDYFSEIGRRVLNAERLKSHTDTWEPAWALLAAVLGNSKNRGQFVNAFWFDLDAGLGRTEDDPGLQKRLKAVSKPEDWQTARERFRAAEALVRTMQTERDNAHAAWLQEARLAEDLETATGAAAEARVARDSAHGARTALEGQAAAAQAALERADRSRADWEARSPGWLHRLLRTGRWRQWRTRADDVEASQLDAWDACQRLREALDRAGEDLAAATRALGSAERDQSQTAAAYLQCQEAVREAREAFGAVFPKAGSESDPASARRDRELAAPWSDAAFNAARSELFLEALRLHRAFIEHNAARIGPGLGTAIDLIKRSVPADLHPDTRLAAWQLLFLVVPIVSTTFASLARQFEGLGREALGWLLIDEAGQSTPQSAAGAIWRTKRCVAVGDPLQLEPIVSLPHTIEDAIRRHHDLADQWVPSRSSVQRLADAATSHGTTLPGPDGSPLWIGCPLTIHRRCDDPMFSLSNRIAYNGLMLADTPGRGPFTFPGGDTEIYRSAWLHVPPTANDGHWIPAEGRRLDAMLDYLSQGGFDMREVMVVSPFVEVARRLEQRGSRYRLGAAGTVSTAQGKQADIVVIVLGGDPDKPRAATFTTDRPNFLNVAVSRAKRRLYVIGDHSTWSSRPYFSQLAAAIGEPR